MDKSVWSEFKEKPRFESLNGDVDCDVLVIGGGMAGILTAYLLKRSGRDVMLIEARDIGGGITKNTTAVITAQHDTTYCELIKMHGERKAKDYLDVNLSAVESFRELSQNIECDFTDKPSYMYSLTEDFSSERAALDKLGYKAELTQNTGLPFKVKSALKYPDMAEFHPLKFLYALARELKIYENTPVDDIKDGVAFVGNFKIRFKQAVVATHFPFIDRTGFYFAKMFQRRSYVVALEDAGDVRGTYIDDQPQGFYWRNYRNLLILGYGEHRPGTKTKAVERLDAFIAEYYPHSKIAYRWANQDCVTLDSVPYVGRYGSLENVYTLTGFNLWGMTGSMVGAKILTDTLNEKKNAYADTFRPDRSVLRLQLFKNIGAAMLDYIYPTVKRCPHMGCALKYNEREHTWDCSCHGSRFEKDGALIDTPAQTDANVSEKK